VTFDPNLNELAKAVQIAVVRPVALQSVVHREPGTRWRGSTRSRFMQRGETEDDHFLCQFHGRLWEGAEKIEEAAALFRFDLHIVYELPDTRRWTDDQLNAFAETSTQFQAWPYWREFVQSSAARMQVEAPMLNGPVLLSQNADEQKDV
jgi:hypothetical protein